MPSLAGDFVNTEGFRYAELILWYGKQLDRNVLRGQLCLLQTRMDYADYHSLYNAAVKDVRKRDGSTFLQWIDDWYRHHDVVPRHFQKGRGQRKATSVVIECLVDIHLSDPRFAGKDRELMKNKIEHWRKKGETWFEIIHRFGAGILLLVPPEEPEGHFKFTKDELSEFLRVLTSRKTEFADALAEANQFMAETFTSQRSTVSSDEVPIGSTPQTASKQIPKKRYPLSPLETRTGFWDSPSLQNHITSQTNNHFVTVPEPTFTSPITPSPNSSHFLQELRCINAVSHEGGAS
ncbi:uncharacterized protein Z518_11058 [Rhinocladiella mackenziei CBS 650.93]|uniref:Uncharacterized protein n=1 Tax=Rhinocladiella mackenziei CBS 650.93 TaxID=1442369 RepID=A0A0D2I8S9_9EURO|nr:uncharacterized protein Z518_11058 [Rhinocladiella mackenziei CBS 650.93]KIW99645.1 hypothetical protein Z518_11058 [Rhinocladiella mackenziei CBS 650.93]